MGNDLDVTLDDQGTRSPWAPDTDLTFRTWYDIEEGYDYGFVEVSADGGATWDTVKEYTGSDTDHWADTVTVDLAAYAGKDVLIRFEYMTDGGVALKGWEVTDIAVENVVLPASAFTTDGWIRVDGEWQQKTDRYYIAEYRTYDGFDESLKNCYQWNNGYASWVDWFSYNRGLHLIYRDTFYQDNDVATHIGAGGWMVVDAHPQGRQRRLQRRHDRLRGLLAAAHPGARRVVQPQADQDAEHLLHRLRPGLGRRREHRSRQGRTAEVQRREHVLVRRGPGGRGQDPQEPRRAHQRQVDGLRHHDHLGRQREVTRRLTAT